MPTIEMSSNFPNAFTAGVTTYNYYWRTIIGYPTAGFADSSYSGILSNTFSGLTSRIRIMQGTVPSDFSGLTLATSRSSDILVNFSSFSVNTNSNPVVATAQYTTAAASGTATWFWILSYNPSTNAIFQQAFGTIGTTGSGADLEIANTSITSSNYYRLGSLLIRLPTSWTY